MKTFIISILVLLLLITGIFAYSAYLEKTTSKLSENLHLLAENLKKEHWENCTERINKLVKYWKTNEPILAMFNDHEDVDHIKLSISELKVYIENRNQDEALKTLEEAFIYLERIRKNENLSLENVLSLTHGSLSCHIML